jgi:TPR repeat protein
MKKAYLIGLFCLTISACQSTPEQANVAVSQLPGQNSDRFFIVDCLLPGKIKKLGQTATYVTARRAIKATASECEIRGGEYTAYDRANYATSLRIWLPRAQEGDPEAQAYVGEIYEKGLGLTPDYQIARQWYLKAAEQGNSRAQINLGYLYENGLGVPKDIAKATEWYKKASGLADTNIDYAFTMSTAGDNKNEEITKELQLLKTELKNSQQESQRLAQKLQSTRQQLHQESKRQKTAQAQPSVSSGKTESTKRLEQKYLQLSEKLKLQLEETEKRANQMAQQLKQKSTEQNNAELKLLDAQAQLARVENRYLEQQKQYEIQYMQLENKQKLEQQIQQQNAQLQTYHNKEKTLQTEKDNLLNVIKQLQQSVSQKQSSGNLQQTAEIQRLTNELKNSQDEAVRLSQQLQLAKQKLDTENQRQSTDNQALTRRLEQNYSEQVAQLKAQLKQTENRALQLSQVLEKSDSQRDSEQLKLIEAQANLARLEQQQLEQQKNYELKLKELESQKKNYQQQTSLAQNEIKQFEQKLKQQNSAVKSLEAEKSNLLKTIAQLQKAVKTQRSTDKPEIEILDPAFVVMRGTPTVTLRSVVDFRTITGKVSSSAGILSLMVNDRKSDVDPQGLFQSNVALHKSETPVSIIAIDSNGKKNTLDFIMSLKEARQVQTSQPLVTQPKKVRQNWSDVSFGNYYALIIANNNYAKISSLDTPANDARAIESILKNRYGFKTELLFDGTRYQILSKLNELRSKLTREDNLLIYYAGHGELDKINMRGHWLPVDADADNTANWISTIALTDILNSMSVKHVMVIADSCYSGAMSRSSLARLGAGKTTLEKKEWLKAMLKARSRTVLTSGGLKPVLDGGGGNHSVFAKVLIDVLNDNQGLLEGQELYREISSQIVARAAVFGVEQVPEYAPIRHAGHEAGEFFFVPN